MSQDKKVGIGIIGAGNIAQNCHIPSYLKQEDVELVAICDINEARAKEAAERFGFKHYYVDFNDMLKLKEIDAVSVCTWNNAHAAAAIAAANAGKDILCEKPMAMNVEQAEAMIKAARENNVIFMMGFTNRYRADSKLLKEYIDNGRLGDIYFARAGWLRRRGTPLGWFTDAEKSGGGPLIDIGVHVIDLTWYFMGKPKPVSVVASTYAKFGDYKTKGVDRWVALDHDNPVYNTEDAAAGFIKFDNGASLSFEVSWAINGKDTGIYSQIFGTKAGANLDPLTIYGEEDDYLVDKYPTFSKENNFDNEIRHFLDCVKSGAEPISPAEDGLAVQKMLNGIYASAQSGKEILL